MLESKSNERLRPDGIAHIQAYLLELASFLPLGRLPARVASVQAFRCLANGGVDPTVLAEEVPQHSPKETSMRVTDTIYLQTLIRDCGAIAIISAQTFQAYSDYSASMAELRETSAAIQQAAAKQRARAEAAAALAAAQDAVTFKLRVRGDGSVDSGSSATSTTATSVSTSSSTSSSTSTN